MIQPFLFATTAWVQVKDGNPTFMEIFAPHYSARRTRKIFQCIGPGEKMALMTPDASAIFAWRKYKSDDGQVGVNNCIFRSNGGRASDLIRSAMVFAWARWPGERLYTYVNPRAVQGTNPGYCYLMAGWRKCGITKTRKLLIFEALPEWFTKGNDAPPPRTTHDPAGALPAADAL